MEHSLLPETVIKVKEIDLWPHANYAEKYLYTSLERSYYKTMHNTRDQDTWQWKQLHELTKQSKQTWLTDKEYFSITDNELLELPWIRAGEVRSLLIIYKVPIKIKGIKTIDEIAIHVHHLIEALKKELDAEYSRKYRKADYEALIGYLYDHYMPSKKATLVQRQQADFLNQLIIQQGDILELKDGRIVIVKTIFFDGQNNINVTYLILKTNLETSNRSRTIDISNIVYVLKNQEFLDYLAHIPGRHLSLLRKWMLPRKKELGQVIFQPDLTKQYS